MEERTEIRLQLGILLYCNAKTDESTDKLFASFGTFKSIVQEIPRVENFRFYTTTYFLSSSQGFGATRLGK